jgi:OmpA-OmpF porin, OOP family
VKTSVLLLLLFLSHTCTAQLITDTNLNLHASTQQLLSPRFENLGFRINSELAELRPIISRDGNLLFFVCEGHPENTRYNELNRSQDIWYSERDTLTGNWKDAVHMDYPFNTAFYNAVFWISPDNNKLLIRNAFDEGKLVGNGVSICVKQSDGSWGKPQMLIIKNYEYYDKGLSSGATMSNDEQVLLLYMSEAQGSTLTNIYICFLQSDGTWSEPESISKKINYYECAQMAPFLAADNLTLYFSSDRLDGLGNQDIWMTRRLDDSWKKWSVPVNLGDTVNTQNFEAFFAVETSGAYAYMSSTYQSLGKTDIVRVKLNRQEQPVPVTTFRGKVFNAKTKEPLIAKLYYESITDSTLSGFVQCRPGDAEYLLALPQNHEYKLRIANKEFFTRSEYLASDSLTAPRNKIIEKDFYLEPAELYDIIQLDEVKFDGSKWKLQAKSRPKLDSLAKLLLDNPAIIIEIRVHTDADASEYYNLRLSNNRAKAVAMYMIEKGIHPGRVLWVGYYSKSPTEPGNKSKEERKSKDRVEYMILRN